MQRADQPRAVVVNFNAPELHHLAQALASSNSLVAYVRPYVNKQRRWERALAVAPVIGSHWAGTFGRRTIADPSLAAATREAGVLPDVCAAALGRLAWPSVERRRLWTTQLHRRVRDSVAQEACRHVLGSDVIVGYEGFALPAFRTAAGASRLKVLNYPVAHHRQRRRVRLAENEREPEFACTWPDFDDWPQGHEERLDEEIDIADMILVGSTYAASTFIAEGVDPERMRVIPYGVDLETFRVGNESPAAGFEVIYAGQLTQRKGLAYLLRGYRLFARPDSRLTLVGAVVGSDLPLKQFAGAFEHVPHQTRSALAARYRRAHAFVLPTLIEGMPLVVLEAMACGLPVIVTANGPGDIVRDGVDGFVVPERDERAIASRLDHLYRHPDMRSQMGRAAAQRAKEFSWARYSDSALEALAGLNASRSSATRASLP